MKFAGSASGPGPSSWILGDALAFLVPGDHRRGMPDDPARDPAGCPALIGSVRLGKQHQSTLDADNTEDRQRRDEEALQAIDIAETVTAAHIADQIGLFQGADPWNAACQPAAQRANRDIQWRKGR
jgi:hypothetical protein